jgi:hypothetical protein
MSCYKIVIERDRYTTRRYKTNNNANNKSSFHYLANYNLGILMASQYDFSGAIQMFQVLVLFR